MDSITMRLSNVTVINHDLEANREGKGIEPTYSFYPQYSMPKRSPPPPHPQCKMYDPLLPTGSFLRVPQTVMLRRWNNISIHNRAVAREREGANSKDSDRFHNFAIFILQTLMLFPNCLLGWGSPLPLTRWGPKAGTRPLALLLCNPGCTPPPSHFLDISGYGPSWQTHGPLLYG